MRNGKEIPFQSLEQIVDPRMWAYRSWFAYSEESRVTSHGTNRITSGWMRYWWGIYTIFSYFVRQEYSHGPLRWCSLTTHHEAEMRSRETCKYWSSSSDWAWWLCCAHRPWNRHLRMTWGKNIMKSDAWVYTYQVSWWEYTLCACNWGVPSIKIRWRRTSNPQ